jgi:S-DNA-T family DNA segregation ATPase FtsK/SpoIIIE
MVLAVIPLGWAWRVISHRGLPWFWLHVALLPVTVCLAATLAALFPVSAHWPLHAGYGGLIGAVMYTWLIAFVGFFSTFAGTLIAGSVLVALTLISLAFTLGLTLGEWQSAGAAARDGFYRGLGAAFRAGGALHRGYGQARIWAAGRRWRVPGPRKTRQEPIIEAAPEPTEQPAPPAPAERIPAARIEQPSVKPRSGRRERAERQPALDFGSTETYDLPPLALLHQPSPRDHVRQVNTESLEQNARLLESVLEDFGVHGTIVKVRPGPVVTLYELEPAPGTKSSRVIGLADDIARSMSAVSARVSVIPGRNAIGIELPNANRETVYLREMLASSEYESNAGELGLALGKEIGGAPMFADLTRMPHLLIAGTTGSGKSVAVNVMILSLLYRLSPEQCRLIMIDPKMLELSVYDGIPHLLSPVVTDPQKAVVALRWAVREMENRYRRMSELGVRNIGSYNDRVREAARKGEELRRTVQTGFDAETGEPIFEDRQLDSAPLPLIVVIVDEMADLMMVAGKEIEGAIQRLAQMARAAGIHLIMATQRPSVDVITGTIKANFPTRVSFQVTSKIDSRTILGEQGAEQLLGAGDMLYMPGAGRITRVHGPFVSDQEVEQVVSFLKAQGAPEYLQEVTEDDDGAGTPAFLGPGAGNGKGGDALYDQAIDLISRERKASTSFVQRHLQIGYNRAARIIEQMEADGIIGPANHVGKREVLTRPPDEFD